MSCSPRGCKELDTTERLNNNSGMRMDLLIGSVQFISVAQSCLTLRSHESQHARPPCPSPAPGVYLKLMSTESVMPSSHLVLCRPLLLLPPHPQVGFLFFGFGFFGGFFMLHPYLSSPLNCGERSFLFTFASQILTLLY